MQINKNTSKYIGTSFIILSIILCAISISLAFTLNDQRMKFFDKENIIYEEFSVKMRDGARIYGILYADKISYHVNNNSISTILMLNGINSRKENNIYKAYQLVNLGYAVFSVEQRGHGESEGPSGFLGKEPDDMMEILDYIEITYQFANISHFGLFGFSYGGGIGAILQAKDERIHTSVLYHPLSSLDSLLENIPLQNLIGSTPNILDIEEIEDAYDIANESNTNNLLLIHGEADKLILPKDSIGLYESLNGSNRSDIELILRTNLDHGGNENDRTSLKYSLLWFEHFYHNRSIDISKENLESQSSKFILLDFNYPNGAYSENLIIASAISSFIGLSILLIKLKILPKWVKLPSDTSPYDEREELKIYKNMIIKRTIIYLTSSVGVGVFCYLLNTSLLYGYFIIYPLVSTIFLLFIPSELYLNWKAEWKNWLKNDSVLFLYSLLAISVPILLFLGTYNLNAKIMLKPIIPVLNSSLIPYLIIGTSSGILDYVYLRELKSRHVYISLIIRPISLLLFIIFVPIPPFPLLGGLISHIGFFLLFGLITFYIRQLVMVLSKFYKNNSALYFLIMTPFILFFFNIFFRII